MLLTGGDYMRYIKNGSIFEDDSVYTTGVEEVSINSGIDINYFFKGVNRHTIKPVFRIRLLSHTESVIRDITEYVTSGSMSISYESGQRRTMNLEIINFDGTLTPKGNEWLWGDNRFSLECGIIVQNLCIWCPQGIYVPQNISENKHKSTVSVSLADKFSLFGKTNAMYTIYSNSKIFDIVQSLLYNLNEDGFYTANRDNSPFIFPVEYKDTNIQYKISKDIGEEYSSIIKEAAEVISCDVYYNERGILTYEPQKYDIGCLTQPILWKFDVNDMCMTDNKSTVNFSQTINHIVVTGNVMNGKLFEADVKNTNPSSPFSTDKIGDKIKVIKDTNLYSDWLCLDRANYELIKESRNSLTKNYSCTYIPHLDVNKLIIQEDENGVYKKFLTQSVNMSFNNSENGVEVGLVDVSQLPFVV